MAAAAEGREAAKGARLVIGAGAATFFYSRERAGCPRQNEYVRASGRVGRNHFRNICCCNCLVQDILTQVERIPKPLSHPYIEVCCP